MTRIDQALAHARDEGRAALIIYLCAGDAPGGLAGTVELVVEAADAGADIVELGVPFSDPTADGPAIQRASRRSLDAGTTLTTVLQTIAQIRDRRPNLPLLLFGYYNPVYSYGEEALVRDAAQAGVDGFLVVDLPPEEAKPFHAHVVKADLSYVPLLAPTSTPERIDEVRRLARGFVYYVSMTGVTGSKAADLPVAAERAHDLADRMQCPVAVGFGIATPEDARIVGAKADGVVVGSAVVRAIAESADLEAAKSAVRAIVTGLATGCVRDSLA